MPGHKILGKDLGAFELSGGGAGAKAGQTRCCEPIDYTSHQRRFRPDNGQADLVFLGKFNQPFDIFGSQWNVFHIFFQFGAGVTGSNIYGIHFC